MARISYIAHDQDREDQKVEEKAERRAVRKLHIVVDEPDPNFGDLNPDDPEFDSVDEFADYLYDDEREDYDHHELACLNFRTGLRIQVIKATLEEAGFSLKRRALKRDFQGFSRNPHNRWTGAQ
jgi:hypothetical protein